MHIETKSLSSVSNQHWIARIVEIDREDHGVYQASYGPSSLLVTMRLFAVSKPSSRTSKRKTDFYKQLVDHESVTWLQPAHRIAGTAKLVDNLPTLI